MEEKNRLIAEGGVEVDDLGIGFSDKRNPSLRERYFKR